MDDRLLMEIAKRPFDGVSRVGNRRGKGSRRAFIVNTLRENGLDPSEDKYGNVWVESGKRGHYSLLSSHMDLDRACPKRHSGIKRNTKPKIGKCYQGILDNAVGCYLNLLTAINNKSGSKTLHVFTASEEVNPKRPNAMAMSAKDVIRFLKEKKIKPDLCVAIDVTYPKLRVSPTTLARKWEDCDHSELFDLKDATHSYVDGIVNRRKDRSVKAAKRFISRYTSVKSRQSKMRSKVALRDLPAWDEAEVYSKIAPSFAFGPVGYGKYDEPDQLMPRRNIKTAYRFLRCLTSSN